MWSYERKITMYEALDKTLFYDINDPEKAKNECKEYDEKLVQDLKSKLAFSVKLIIPDPKKGNLWLLEGFYPVQALVFINIADMEKIPELKLYLKYKFNAAGLISEFENIIPNRWYVLAKDGNDYYFIIDILSIQEQMNNVMKRLTTIDSKIDNFDIQYRGKSSPYIEDFN